MFQGFEAISHLFRTSSAPQYHLILGARNAPQAQRSFASVVDSSSSQHKVNVEPLELSDLSSVRIFAKTVLRQLNDGKLDVLLLCAGIVKAADSSKYRSRWSEAFVVNHLGKLNSVDPATLAEWGLAQHYLIHLLREKIQTDRSRIVFVSSTKIKDVETIGEPISGSEQRLR